MQAGNMSSVRLLTPIALLVKYIDLASVKSDARFSLIYLKIIYSNKKIYFFILFNSRLFTQHMLQLQILKPKESI